MKDRALEVLLVEGDPREARRIRSTLADGARHAVALVCVDQLAAGLEWLADHPVDALLVDVGAPDVRRIEPLARVLAEAPHVPLVVLLDVDDERIALDALQMGAQDCVVKSEASPGTLLRALRHAVERQRVQTAVRRLSLIDDLTGLYNRRGFFAVGQKQLLLARRMGCACALTLADVDGLKAINDRFGHAEGDRTLIDAAAALAGTFRESDVLARLGGDEFVALAVDVAADQGETIERRLGEELGRGQTAQRRGHPLRLSLGTAHLAPCAERTLEDLVAEADGELYRRKRARAAIARGA